MSTDEHPPVLEATTVGLCGLGNMGTPIASRLTREFRVLGYDADAARVEAAGREYGVVPCAAVADLARRHRESLGDAEPRMDA